MPYVDENWTAKEIKPVQMKTWESLWVEIKRDDGKEVVFGICYVKPGNSVEELEGVFEEAKKCSSKEVVIMGDFNTPGVEWGRFSSTTGRGQLIIDNLLKMNMSQCVDQPTRESNILDLVITNTPEKVDKLRVLSPIGSSDHNVVLFDWAMEGGRRKEKVWELYDFKKANFEAIREEFTKKDWKEEFKGLNSDGMWNRFVEINDELKECFVPKRKVKVGRKGKSNKPWFNGEVKRAIIRKQKAWRNYRDGPTLVRLSSYKESIRQVKVLVAQRKLEYEIELAKSVNINPKRFYSYASNKCGSKGRIKVLRDVSGKECSEAREVCNILNDQFASVFTKEDLSNPVLYQDRRDFNVESVLEEMVFTKEMVLKEIRRLKANKSAGIDGMDSNYVKALDESIVDPLCRIFRESMESGIVPVQWKRSNVTPLFKKGVRDSPDNYRPVSLNSVVGKLMEQMIKKEMSEHLDKGYLIKENQHGFQEKKSCLTNLLEANRYITGCVDKGVPVDVFYFDCKKAFDKVPHYRLGVKLRAYGVRGKVGKWIGNWLEGREQRVLVDGVRSDWVKVESGVPQGSVLGPVLFKVFVDDVDEGLKSNCLKFADDLKMMAECGKVEEVGAIKEDLVALEDWAKTWQMEWNVKKCKVMHMGKGNTIYPSLLPP